MNPTPTSGYVNPLLTSVALTFIGADREFIADRVFPNVPVQMPAGTYHTYDRADWLRADAQLRGPSSPSAGGGWRTSTDTYSTAVYAIHKDIDAQTRAIQGQYSNLDADATEYVTRQLLLKKEKTWASTYFAASIWTNQWAGVSGSPSTNQFKQWNDSAATPIENIATASLTMATLTGFRPNKLILGPSTYLALVNHPEILDRIKYTQQGVVTSALMASLFGVDEVLVPFVVENTADEGATAAYSQVYGKAALLVYAAPRPSMTVPSAGYTFSWAGYLGVNNAQGVAINRFEMPELKSDRVEGEIAYAQKLVSAELGFYFTTAVA